MPDFLLLQRDLTAVRLSSSPSLAPLLLLSWLVRSSSPRHWHLTKAPGAACSLQLHGLLKSQCLVPSWHFQTKIIADVILKHLENQAVLSLSCWPWVPWKPHLYPCIHSFWASPLRVGEGRGAHPPQKSFSLFPVWRSCLHWSGQKAGQGAYRHPAELLECDIPFPCSLPRQLRHVLEARRNNSLSELRHRSPALDVSSNWIPGCDFCLWWRRLAACYQNRAALPTGVSRSWRTLTGR